MREDETYSLGPVTVGEVIKLPEDSADSFHGIDVNEYTTTIVYGLFNDPQLWEPRFADGSIPESLREVVLETPLFEDEQASRALRHARLTNEDRRRQGTLDRDGMVVVKRQVILKSKWLMDVGEAHDLVNAALESPPGSTWPPPGSMQPPI